MTVTTLLVCYQRVWGAMPVPLATRKSIEFPSYSLGSVKASGTSRSVQDAEERHSGGGWVSRVGLLQHVVSCTEAIMAMQTSD